MKANSIEKLSRGAILACRVSRWHWDTLNLTHCLLTWGGGSVSCFRRILVCKSIQGTDILGTSSAHVVPLNHGCFRCCIQQEFSMFSFWGICLTRDLTQHVSVQKSPWGMNLHHSVRLLSSAFYYPGMIPHDPTEMTVLSNLSVTSMAVGFTIGFTAFARCLGTFCFKSFVNVHLFA